MTITLTTPVERPTETTVRLVSFTINTDLRYAEARFEIGRVDAGAFVKTSGRTLVFQDDSITADFTYQKLLNNITEIRDLRSAVETEIVALGVFDGAVS